MKYLYLLGGMWALSLIATATSGRDVEDIAILGLIFMSALAAISIFVERKKPSGLSNQSVNMLDQRMARLQEQLDSVAIEVERIGEGQRFLTKLAAEREKTIALPPPHGDPLSRGN